MGVMWLIFQFSGKIDDSKRLLRRVVSGFEITFAMQSRNLAGTSQYDEGDLFMLLIILLTSIGEVFTEPKVDISSNLSS